jgi:hypothetical protein
MTESQSWTYRVPVGGRCALPPNKLLEPQEYEYWEQGLQKLSEITERPKEQLEEFIKILGSLDNPHLALGNYLLNVLENCESDEDKRNHEFIWPEIEYYLDEDHLLF